MAQLHALLEVAAGQPHEGDPVAVLGVHIRLNLEHKAADLLGLGRDLRGVVADDRRLRPRRGGRSRQPVEQFPDPEIIERRAEIHRRQRAFAVGLQVKGRTQLGRHARAFFQRFDLRAVEHVLKRGIIHAGDLQAVAGKFALGVVVQRNELVVDQVVAALELPPHADGPRRRRHVERQRLFDLVKNFKGLAGFAVHLVDEGHDRDVAQAADLEQLQGLGLDTLGGVDDHDGGIHGRQRAVGVFGKVTVTGRVEQVEGTARVVVGHDRRGDGDPALALHLHPVRGRIPARVALGLDRPGELDRTAEQQQLLGQRGLARIRVRNDREGPPSGDFILQHSHGLSALTLSTRN